MSVYENSRGRWMYDFWLNQKRHAGYCFEPDGARCLNRRSATRAESRVRERVAIAPALALPGQYTLAQAFADLTPKWERQDDWTNKKRYMHELLGFFGADAAVIAIDANRIGDYTTFARAQPRKVWAGGPRRDPALPTNARFWKIRHGTRGPATVNLYLKLLRQALDHAAQVRDPLTGAPVIAHAPKVIDLDVPKRKARPVPDAVLSEVLDKLPQHTRDAVVLTLFFGFRRGEVFSLEIKHVDVEARGVRLEAEDVKDDEDAFLPGSPEAMAYLQRLVDEARARGVTRLITWQRKRKDPELQKKEPWRPLSSSKRAWSTAMKAIAGTHGKRWRWHDIRAAFITHVAVTSGAIAAQHLARHSRYETTQGYVEPADEVRRAAADRAADRPALALVGKKSQTARPKQ